MGEHRNSGRSRGVAKGPVVVLVAIALFAALVFGWFQLRDRISDQGVEAADKCVEGATVLPVTVDPDIAPVLTELARMFDATAPVVRDQCVTVSVTAADSVAVTAALNGVDDAWDPSGVGPRPALWIPASSDSVAALTNRASVNGTPKSVAQSPLVLAVPTEIASGPIGSISWADLPRLQSEPGSLDALGSTGWGSLRLRLPTGPDTWPTSATLVAVAVTAAGSSALTDVASPEIVTAVSDLATTDRGASVSGVATSQNALDELGADTFPNSDFHALPVTEQQLFAEGSGSLRALSPAGATPVADHPGVVLSGAWVDETLGRAAAQFADFVRAPEHVGMFTGAGFRVSDAVPDATESVPFPDRAPQTAPVDGVVNSALTTVLVNPVLPRRATVLLDVSGSMNTDEGGRTRLQNTAAALTTQFDRVPGDSELGLWVYSKDLDGTRAYRIAVPTGPVAQPLSDAPRRQRLDEAVAGLTPRTATSTYESVAAAFSDAVDGYVPGTPNSVVLITDGPNDDTSITPAVFATLIGAMSDPAKPVAVNVVSIGSNQDEQTLRSLASDTGGSFTSVGSSADPAFSDILGKLLY